MSVLDASALLAFLQGEPGADEVEGQLAAGDAVCGAANWAEVAQKIQQRGGDWALARGLLFSYDLTIEDVTIDDAETAARLWTTTQHLSLGDRLCLALAQRLRVPACTADGAWGESEWIRQIRAAGSP